MHIPHSHHAQREFSVQMTPMIDVVFLLLIFFVCTASFQIPESVLPSPLSLDGASADAPSDVVEPELERVVIEIVQREDAGMIRINGRECASLDAMSELLVALVEIDASLPVILDIGGNVPVGTAIDVYDRCRLAGFRKIQFAAGVR